MAPSVPGAGLASTTARQSLLFCSAPAARGTRKVWTRAHGKRRTA